MASYLKVFLLTALLVQHPPKGLSATLSSLVPDNAKIQIFLLSNSISIETHPCWEPLSYALQSLAALAFMADSALLVTDMTISLNGTQNEAMIALPASGLAGFAIASYIMAASGFRQWQKGLPQPPGGRGYHFITTAGGATGLMIICTGLMIGSPWTIRVGNLVALVFFSSQGITTNWRAPGLHPVTKWQIIGSNIGGMLFTASSFIPEDNPLAFQATLTSALLTISAAIIPAVLKYIVDKAAAYRKPSSSM